MKQHTKLVAFIAFVEMMALFSISNALKIAFVVSEAILPNMPAYKQAKSDLEAYGKQVQKILDGK